MYLKKTRLQVRFLCGVILKLKYMTTINLFRLVHFAVYAMVASQVIFYLLVLSDAFRLIKVETFLEQRKAVDTVIAGRYTLLYYSGLVLSLVLVALTIRQPGSLMFITSLVAFLCLVGDVLIAKLGNIPLNEQVNAYVAGVGNTDWEAIRIKWLNFMKYRGMLEGAGLLSLAIGLIFGKK